MASKADIRRLRPRPWIDRPPTRLVAAGAVDNVVLLGSRREVNLSGVVQAAPIKATRSSAAQLNLTVADPERELLGPLLDRNEDLLLDDNIDTEIGGIWWRLMGAEPTDTGWTIPLEDRAGAWLRRHDKPMRAERGRVSRARFMHRMYREAGGGIDLWVPELHDPQRVAAAKAESPGSNSAAGDVAGSGDGEWSGLPAKVRIYNGHVEMTAARRTIAARLLGVAVEKRAPEIVALALAMAGLVESHMENPGVVTDQGSTSIGSLQPQVGLSAGPRGTITRAQALDVEYMAECFLDEPGFASKGGALKLHREHPDWTAGQIAQRVEMSGHPDRYDQTREGGMALLKAFRGGVLLGASGGDGSSGGTAPYVFERGQNGKREDSLTCANRLAQEVGWRHWIYGGQGYFASDVELINTPIVLRIDRDNPAVIAGPHWRWDVRHSASAMRVELLVDRLPEPGQVVYVDREGPASGRWQIDSVDADLAVPVDLDGGGLALRCSLELARAQKKQPEPSAASAAGRTAGEREASTVGGEGPSAVYGRAIQISKEGRPYVWGGGHAHAGKPDGGDGSDSGVGYDCSGYVGACLAAAGWGFRSGDSIPGSGTLASSWGKPGRGKYVTLWANDQHVYLEFHGLGKYKRADTSSFSSDGSSSGRGARVRTGTRTSAGFTPRHWPGH